MAQLAFELSHHDQIKLTARSERMKVNSFWARMRRRFNTDAGEPYAPRTVALPLPSAPIIAVAIDAGERAKETNDALREAAARVQNNGRFGINCDQPAATAAPRREQAIPAQQRSVPDVQQGLIEICHRSYAAGK